MNEKRIVGYFEVNLITQDNYGTGQREGVHDVVFIHHMLRL